MKRGKGLRYKKGCTGHDLDPACPFFFGNRIVKQSGYFIAQLSDFTDVLGGFKGKSQHEIKLYPGPAPFKGHFSPFQDHFFCQSLIDHITQPLASCFGCKGQAAFFHILYLVHDIQGKGVNPQRGKGNINSLLAAFFNQEIQKLWKLGIIAGTQRTQRDFFVSCIVQHLSGILLQHFKISFPNRSVKLSCLAETAASDAAPLNFQHNAVLCNLNKGNYRFLRITGLGDLPHHFFGYNNRNSRNQRNAFCNGAILLIGYLIQRRNINAGDHGSCFQKAFSALVSIFTGQI